ncbi:MAG: prohibitin family protein [Acidobacteria bacterium]|nr:MAG: prohibitin family protein [Acidobacteriota bacterium]
MGRHRRQPRERARARAVRSGGEEVKRPLLVAVLVLAALATAGCGATSSTEVGVRTNLFGIFEKRGAQEIYQPGGVYFFLPVVNAWTTLPISQQNLLMNANPNEGDRPVPDDVTFKTKDGNNVHIDVNVMWRIDPKKAGHIVSFVGGSLEEIRERVVRPVSRSVVRDIFNEITSEEYYQVAIKNRTAELAKDHLARALAPHGILVDMLQVQQHRFDPDYQAAINAQKQAEADRQKLVEQQKAMEVQKKSELEAKRAVWNQRREDALGAAGRIRNEADGYYQTKINQAKAIVATAQAEAEGIRKEAEALGKLGGDAYVKMQVAKQLAQKKILLVPGTNVSTMNVNELVDYLVGRAAHAAPRPAPRAAPEPTPVPEP